MFGLAGISARWTYRYYKRRLVSDVRSITLTYDGFIITDKSGNTFFIPRDEALDSICVGGTALLPPIGNAPPTSSNIEYILFINYNGVTYRVPMLRASSTSSRRRCQGLGAGVLGVVEELRMMRLNDVEVYELMVVLGDVLLLTSNTAYATFFDIFNQHAIPIVSS